MHELEGIAERVRAHLEAKNQARERALALAREATRAAANAIRATHRGEFPPAEKLIGAAAQALAQAEALLSQHPDIFYAGFIHDAQKEYAEASITYAVIREQVLPGPEELKVSYAAYLNGLGEAAGELRRAILDLLRQGEVGRCERLLQAMDDIYAVLVTLDYPDAMTGGLRRTTDMVRGVVERTRGDLTMAWRQRDLEQQLRDLGDKLGQG